MKKINLFAVLAVFAFSPLYAGEDPELAHECTSWMVFSDFTGNNTNILHKNRDSVFRNIAVYLSPAGAKRKWIALGSASTNAGVNSSGLAGAMNSGETTPDAPNAKDKKTTPAMLEVILNSCDTAAEGVAMLQKLLKSGDYYHGAKGSTFLLLDPREGFICEFTSKHFSSQRYHNTYAFRANIWQNPGMPAYSRSTYKAYLHSSARAFIAFSELNRAMDAHGRITVRDSMDISRHAKLPSGDYPNRSVCGKTTCSASTIEIDRQYPDVLSTGYFTLGHPRHTVYLPVPVCTEKLLPSMGTYNWAKVAFARLDKSGFDAPVPEEWLKFEVASMAEYAKAKEEARKLLAGGKRAEAVKLLNAAAFKIWQKAEALLGIKPAGK